MELSVTLSKNIIYAINRIDKNFIALNANCIKKEYIPIVNKENLDLLNSIEKDCSVLKEVLRGKDSE